MEEDLTCPLCSEFFDMTMKMPRLFGYCGHTYCSSCLIDLIKDKNEVFCPEDNKQFELFNPKKGIDSFPINFALNKLIKSKEEEKLRETIFEQIKVSKNNKKNTVRVTDFVGVNFCLAHHKNADLICLTDKKVICSDCVLFGQHREHKYQKIFELKELVDEKLKEVEKRKVKVSEIMNQGETREKFHNLLKEKKTVMKHQFQAVLEKLQSEFISKEKEIYDQIDDLFQNQRNTTKFIGAKAREIRNKQKQINDHLKTLKLQVNEEELNADLLLKSLFSENNLFKENNRLLVQVQDSEKIIQQLLEEELQKIQLEDKGRDFFNKMSKNIYVSGGNPDEEFRVNPDNNKLELISYQRKTSFKPKSKRQSRQEEVNNQFKKKPDKDLSLIDLNIDSDDSISPIKKKKKKSKIQAQLEKEIQNSKKDDFILEQEVVNKTKRNSLYEQIKIPNEQTNTRQRQTSQKNPEIINYQGKNLTDNKMVRYLRKIEKQEKLMILNLNDNSITDQGFKRILVTLCNHKQLEKLFLKNNKLTENSLSILYQFAPALSNLKYFDLSMNMLSEMKDYQEDINNLKELGITINLQIFFIYNLKKLFLIHQY